MTTTGQIAIDFLFLLILVIHIVKIKHLQEENHKLKKGYEGVKFYLEEVQKAVLRNQEHISKLMDWYQEILEN